jgi:hypothetical protein
MADTSNIIELAVANQLFSGTTKIMSKTGLSEKNTDFVKATGM